MGNAVSPKPSDMNLEEERLHFFSALGNALAEWARVEAHLYCVFMVCLRAPHERAAAAFYAVENFRSKLEMVDRVVQLAVSDPKKIAEWDTLYEKLVKKSKKRNELVHHDVLEDEKQKVGKRLVLRPAILNPHSPSVFDDVGLHISELQVRHDIFQKLGDDLRKYYADLCKMLGLPPGQSS